MAELPPLIAHLRADISGFAAGMAEAGAIAKAETDTATGAFNGLAAVGKVALIGVAAAAIGVGVASIKMAGDFEASTTRLITSAGESRENIDLVRKGMLQMAGDVGTSAMDLSKGMYIVESAGYHGAQGLTVLRAAAEGAKTENAALDVVANATTSALQDYHLKAEDAAMVTTKLVAGVSVGKTTFQEYTSALHSVLPIASAAHVSLNDILADVSAMTVHGMSAQQSTENLAHTIQHLQTVTAPQAKELAALGISARELSDDLGSKGLSGTLQMISNVIQQHMGPDGKVVLNLTDALKKMSPEVQGLGIAAATGSITMGQYTKAAKGLSVEAAGQAQSFATLLKSTHGVGQDQKTGAEIMQAYAAALKAATGDSTTLNTALMLTGENAAYTNNAVKTVAGATTEAGGHVKGWAEIQATLNNHIDRWRYGIEAAGISLGTILIPYVIKAMSGIEAFVGFLQRNHDVVIALAGAITGVLLLAIGAWAVAMIPVAVSTLIAIAPILLLIAVAAILGAAIFLLITHWSQLTGFMGGVLHTVLTATGSFFQWLGTVIHKFVTDALGSIGSFFSWLGTAASKAWSEFAKHPQYWVAFILAFLIVKFAELLIAFVKFVAEMKGKAEEWAVQMIGKALDMASRFNAAVGNELSRLPGQVWNLLIQVSNQVIRWTSILGNAGLNAARSLGQAIVNEMNNVPNQVYWIGTHIAQGIINGLKSYAGAAISAARQFVSGMIAGAKAAAGISSPAWVFLWEVGKPIAEGVAEGVQRTTPVAVRALTDLLGAMRSAGTAMAEDGSLVPAGFYSQQDLTPVIPPGMVRAEDGSLVPAGFYSQQDLTPVIPPGMVRAEDGSLVPASYYSQQDLTPVSLGNVNPPPAQGHQITFYIYGATDAQAVAAQIDQKLAGYLGSI